MNKFGIDPRRATFAETNSATISFGFTVRMESLGLECRQVAIVGVHDVSGVSAITQSQSSMAPGQLAS